MPFNREVRSLADLRAGDHVCCLYESEEEHRAVVVPFVRLGLARGEKVLYLAEDHPADAILGLLRADGVEVDLPPARGQLRIRSAAETYIREECFDPDRMIAFLQAETAQALGKGYSALRIVGEMGWALGGVRGCERLVEYETKLNRLFQDSACLALCQYDRRRFEPVVLLNILHTHPLILIGSRVSRNPYYVSPAASLENEPAARLDQWLKVLAATHRADADLRESEERYRSLFEHSLDAVLLTIPDGRILAANPAACRMFGRTEEEICRIGRAGLMDPGDPRVEAAIVDRMRTGRIHAELTMMRGDGTRFIAEVSSSIFKAADGSLRTSMVIRDATDRARAEEALRQLSRFNQGILDSLPAHICVLDDKGIIVAVNRAWREFAAANPPLSTAADIGANYFAVCDAVTGDDAGMAREAVRGLRAVGGGEVPEFSFEYPCHSPDTPRWFLLRATRLHDATRSQIVVTHIDITERTQAETALRESEDRYRGVVEDQTEVICRFRADGVFTFVNQGFCRFFGMTRLELEGQKWKPKALAEDLPLIELRLRSLSPANPVVLVENRVHSAEGRVRWMQFANRGFFDRDGQLLEIQAVGRDITERKQAEDALQALSRRQLKIQEEERRLLARELHDEIGQLLTGLKLTLEMATVGGADRDQEPLRESLELVVELIRQVRELSLTLRPPILDDLGLLPALLWQFERYTARTQIRVDFEHVGLEGRPCSTDIETATYRIVQEALTNVARHAKADAVQVRIRVEQGRLALQIEDHGCGFESTIELMPGASSGLAGMHERARLLGGRLRIESSPGAGTRILADLPLG